MSNESGREIPKSIYGYGKTTCYAGPFSTIPTGEKVSVRNACSFPGQQKKLGSVKEAIQRVNLKDGMAISFHHHLRNGDEVMNLVLNEIAELGIKNITIHVSSLSSAHEPLIEHIRNGVVTDISTSGLRGTLGKLQSKENILGRPVVFRTHGGRARAIEEGNIKIDVAFIAAACCDDMGNMNGIEGPSAFGAMGYPIVDAQYADSVVAITDNLQPFPIWNISIPMTLVDYVVEVDNIGDSNKIASGATRVTNNPTDLLIAENAAKVLIALGCIKNGFSFQAGSGGPSLAVCKFLRSYMEKNEIVGSFAAGGVTGYLVDMLRDGLFKVLLDTQTFDARAVRSLKENANHVEMSASMYANPHNKSCTAHQLDVMILSATEIDESFNLNSITGSTGMIMGALGGAPDTAAGSKITVVVAPTMRKRIPIVVEKVTNIATPGETIDILVTERGICVNPRRMELRKKLNETDLEVLSIQELRKNVEKLTGKPEKIKYTDEIVGVIEYRDGTVLDLIYRVDE
ncbi:citrate lyase subunit alpha [Gottschalkiaceae bacterium SANA]|nr:citrate lyase subunit alpha [Gottschalkiaceae bacterium SANA]